MPQQTLRIALTHAHCWPEVRRGGERYLHELAGALVRRGHTVTVLAGAGVPGTAQEDGVLVFRIARGPAGPEADGRFATRVLPYLVGGSFDVVHSLGPLDAVASIEARPIEPGRRTVYTNLGNPLRAWWDTLPTKEAHERVVAEIDVYGCLSRFGRSCLLTDYGREGMLTPGGVRLQTFAPVARKEVAPTLLYSGALDVEGKCLGVLMEALALLAEREPRVRLWLSGSGDPGPLLSAAPAAARERTDVLPLGRPDDQPSRYSAAWATVLPSVHEAFGLALVESLACGTAIVGTDHASLPELFTPGVGAIAAARDPVALAEACAEALSLASDASTVERCREAASAYDWDTAVAPAIERVYA